MRNKTKLTTLTFTALFAALTAIGAFIQIPLPYIPFSLQSFFCVTSGIILGSRLGALSQILYVAIGLAGLPVFTKGGGIGYVLQPSFGYLLGFIVGAYLSGYIYERVKNKNILKTFLSAAIGLLPIYLIGVPYMYIILNVYMNMEKEAWFFAYYGFLSFITGDIVCCYLTGIICSKIKPVLIKIELLSAK